MLSKQNYLCSVFENITIIIIILHEETDKYVSY